jgi:hypothetical protein
MRVLGEIWRTTIERGKCSGSASCRRTSRSDNLTGREYLTFIGRMYLLEARWSRAFR